MPIRSMLTAALLACLGAPALVHAQQDLSTAVVRMAELEIDPAQLPAFIAAVKEEMEDAVRLEPGVYAIHAVADKDSPHKLRFFEIYASNAAYAAHLQSPHFKKFFATTLPMVRSRKVVETVPVLLSTKKN